MISVGTEITIQDLRDKQLYWYTYVRIPVAASVGATAQQSVAIDNDADFIITDFMGAGITAAPAITTLFLVQFRDDTRANFLQTAPAFSNTVLTNATTLNPLPRPYYLPRRTTMTVYLTNLTATTFDAYITLRGYKVYGAPIYSLTPPPGK